MNYYILIGFFGGAVLITIISILFFKKDKVRRSPGTAESNPIMSPGEITGKVRSLLQEGKKIDAIKLVVRNRKVGLAEGKKFVDSLENNNSPDFSAFENIKSAGYKDLDNGLMDEIRKLLVKGKKIEAIKLVVHSKKMGLKDAKDLVDSFEKKIN